MAKEKAVVEVPDVQDVPDVMRRTPAQELSGAVVDRWFADLCLNLGPFVTTDVYNRLAVEKVNLKAALEAALA